MFFKKHRSKSSSKSTSHSLRVTSADSNSHYTDHDSHHEILDCKRPSETLVTSLCSRKSPSEMDDYEKFLEKSRKDEERAEKMKLKEIKEAERRRREMNMSPWASRM